MISALRPLPAAAGLLVLLALGGCAPPEADAPVSEHVRNSEPPHLVPTSAFEAPRAEGLASARSVEADRDALAARAAALRARGAALAGTPVLDEAERARLEPEAEDAETP